MNLENIFLEIPNSSKVEKKTARLTGAVIIFLVVILVIILYLLKDNITENTKVKNTFKILFTVTGLLYIFYDMIRYQVIHIRGSTKYTFINKLPLHICSLTAIAYIIFINKSNLYIIHQSTFAIAIIGVLIALLITPPPVNYKHTRFYHFYLGHSSIILAYMYFMYIYDSYPTIQDTLYGLLSLSFIELTILFPFNLLFKTNYGYINKSTLHKLTNII